MDDSTKSYAFSNATPNLIYLQIGWPDFFFAVSLISHGASDILNG